MYIQLRLNLHLRLWTGKAGRDLPYASIARLVRRLLRGEDTRRQAQLPETNVSGETATDAPPRQEERRET